MNTKTILIVEDSIDLRELLERALRGYSVITTAEGKEAMRALKSGLKPDVILFDLNMPGMDGHEFLTQLRSNVKTRKTKAIVVSGIDGLAEKATAIGADGFIKKPVNLESLYTEVERQLSDIACKPNLGSLEGSNSI